MKGPDNGFLILKDSAAMSNEKAQGLEFCTVRQDSTDSSQAAIAVRESSHDADQQDSTNRTIIRDQWRLALITLSLALGTFLVALDTMIVGIAVPSITSEFKSLDNIAWYGSAYLLTTTALQPSFGKLYTTYNAKTIYLFCVALFEGSSRWPISIERF